jgi:hypothetical protein
MATLIAARSSTGQGPHTAQRSIFQAIGWLFRGAYRIAAVDAQLALTPANERSRAANLPDDSSLSRFGVSVLRASLREAVAEPLHDHPVFGPVAFAQRGAAWRYCMGH